MHAAYTCPPVSARTFINLLPFMLHCNRLWQIPSEWWHYSRAPLAARCDSLSICFVLFFWFHVFFQWILTKVIIPVIHFLISLHFKLESRYYVLLITFIYNILQGNECLCCKQQRLLHNICFPSNKNAKWHRTLGAWTTGQASQVSQPSARGQGKHTNTAGSRDGASKCNLSPILPTEA